MYINNINLCWYDAVTCQIRISYALKEFFVIFFFFEWINMCVHLAKQNEIPIQFMRYIRNRFLEGYFLCLNSMHRIHGTTKMEIVAIWFFFILYISIKSQLSFFFRVWCVLLLFKFNIRILYAWCFYQMWRKYIKFYPSYYFYQIYECVLCQKHA